MRPAIDASVVANTYVRQGVGDLVVKHLQTLQTLHLLSRSPVPCCMW